MAKESHQATVHFVDIFEAICIFYRSPLAYRLYSSRTLIEICSKQHSPAVCRGESRGGCCLLRF